MFLLMRLLVIRGLTTYHAPSDGPMSRLTCPASLTRPPPPDSPASWLRLETPRLSDGVHFELHTLVLLDAADDLEQVVGVGIASRSEHAHETLGPLVRQRGGVFWTRHWEIRMGRYPGSSPGIRLVL